MLVVPLAADEVELLTLREWDALRDCERVLFERPDHPLLERLVEAGVAAAPFDDEPEAPRSGWALVAEPDSVRVLELARAGARVSAATSDPPDDLSAAHAAPVLRRTAAALGDLAIVMARLRSEDGCPWDREQSHGSLVVHLLDEAHEVIEAIEAGSVGADLEEELGDLLLQVAFHARMAEQDGRFDLGGVARGIVTKLVARHPHVFGDVEVAGAADVLRNWEAIKAEEKRRPDPFEGIPVSLPALLAAAKVQKRAASVGFEAGEQEARSRVRHALAESGPEAVGEALFWLVAAARAEGVDAETALRRATRAFTEGLAETSP